MTAILTLLIALCLTAIAGYVSVLGMMQLFPGSDYVIILMIGSVEIAKVIFTVWGHTNWRNPRLKLWHRTYMVASIAVLMTLTSLGLFGYLSKSHLDVKTPTAGLELRIGQIEQRLEQAKTARQQLADQQRQQAQTLAAMLNVSRSARDVARVNQAKTKQAKDQQLIANQIATKDQEINQLSDSLVPLRLQVNDVSAKLGPIKYVADLFGWKDPDAAVRIVICMILFAFDPLAIVMILSATISLTEKKQNQKANPATDSPHTSTESPPTETVERMFDDLRDDYDAHPTPLHASEILNNQSFADIEAQVRAGDVVENEVMEQSMDDKNTNDALNNFNGRNGTRSKIF